MQARRRVRWTAAFLELWSLTITVWDMGVAWTVIALMFVLTPPTPLRASGPPVLPPVLVGPPVSVLLQPPAFSPMTVNHPGKEPMGRHRRKMLDRFAAGEGAAGTGGTVFLGDSITERFPTALFFSDRGVVNRGIGGDTMGGVRHLGVLDRLDSTVYDLEPRRIVLMIGVNDLLWSRGTAFETKLAQYDYLVWRLRRDRPGVVLWCVSVLPVRGKYAEKNREIVRFNANAERVAARYGARWLGVYRYFADRSGALRPLLARDAVHLNRRGYRKLAHLYRPIFAAGSELSE